MSSIIEHEPLISATTSTSTQDDNQNFIDIIHSLHTTTKEKGFSIRRLPLEIRQLIYTHYLLNNPPLLITFNPNNFKDPHHKLHPLALASPFFQADIPRSLYHATQLFNFKCDHAVRSFSEFHNRKNEVRRIELTLSSHRSPGIGIGGDFIWLVASNFCNVGDLLLDADYYVKGSWTQGRMEWWCVEDAWREAMGFVTVEWRLGDGGFRRVYPRLSLVNRVDGQVMCWSQYDGKGGKDVGCLL